MYANMQRFNTIFLSTLCATTSLSAHSIERISFTWEDINTRDVLRWEGDTAVVRQGTTIQELQCKIALDTRDVDIAIEEFGVPRAWTTLTYSDEKDLARKQQELQEKAAAHGIKMMEDGKQFVVDYRWVIQHSARKVRDVAKTIRSTARRQGYRSTRELVGAFAAFVQSLPYRIPPDFRVNEEGEEILTAGAMMPLETLTKQWGDCDSKSMLFASLVRSIDLVDVSFIVLDDHLFAAVQLTPTHEDHIIRHNGSNWVLVELTDAWPIGRVPAKHLLGMKKGRYSFVDLD